MFTIYNNGIVDYKGSTDNLYNVKSVNEVSKFKFELDNRLSNDYHESKENQDKRRKEEKFLSLYKKISEINESNTQFYFVKDVMIQDVLYIDDSHTIKEAYDLLTDKNFEQIPVTTIDKRIVGVIDAKFILSSLIQNLDEPNTFLSRKLNEINFPEFIATNPEEEIKDVLEVMFDFHIGAMVVADEDGFLKGIISKSYIFKAMATLPKVEVWS